MSSADHDVIVLEAKSYRLDRTLSDYKGRDPLVHNNRSDEMITCLLDVFGTPGGAPEAPELRRAARELRSAARVVKEKLGVPSVFRASAFRKLVESAADIGAARGFLSVDPVPPS